MKPVYLIGYMGSGKTTLGRAAAREWGKRFVDLDEAIEERQGRTVREIFASEGEASFRRMEHEMLSELTGMDDVIVACGGGTPCFHDNMDLMNASGLTVYLDCPVGRLHSRLIEGRDKRPLIAAMSDGELLGFIRKSLAGRVEHYRRATLVFPSGRLENASEIAESVALFGKMLEVRGIN